MKDLFLHYKSVCRFLLIEKGGYFELNTYQIAKLAKVIAFFSIKSLTDFDDLRASNYFFLLKFYFGRRAFLLNYKTEFSLNVLYHSFVVQFVLRKNDVYFATLFALNDFRYCLPKKSLKIVRRRNVLVFKVRDMNIFLERKTSAGFFNLKDKLYIRFLCSGARFQSKFLFRLLKFF